MIELPESIVLSEQIEQTLAGKTIKNAVANANPHSFAWYAGDPADYGAMLSGKQITGAKSMPDRGMNHCGAVNIGCEDMFLSISTPIKYHEPGGKLPKSHQLLVEFTDGAHISCSVQMWGCMMCCPLSLADHCEKMSKQLPSPLTDAFDEAYFETLWERVKPATSAKAFLATEQRIPGLGNGVLQDILFNARIHPKRKLETMGDEEKGRLFHSVKNTLKEMKDHGGRDTEKDLFNRKGGYMTILSKNTLIHPCRECSSGLIRQAFLGGNNYFCPTCQPMVGK
ncbi:MAG: endonuclease VIII [Defluviitaleaceae bacterium]|nr:endonuclease VIII [Defluviitaleaceae bacterium]